MTLRMNLTAPKKYTEAFTPTRKIVFATPFYNHQGWSPYFESVLKVFYFLGKCENIEADFWRLDGDAYVWRARNAIANRFMDSDFDELVFLDSDMEFNLMGMIKLLSHDVPIVGAAYPCKNNWDFFSCLIDCDARGYPITTPEGLIEAKNGLVPTGMMKIKKEVFEKLAFTRPDDYYDRTTKSGKIERTMNFFGHLFEEHVPYGEDTSFCVRCKRAGIPLYVEPDITIRHYGTQAWEGNYHKYLKRQPKHNRKGA